MAKCSSFWLKGILVASVLFTISIMLWAKLVMKDVRDARAIHLTLIRALNVYHTKNGVYPRKILDLKKVVPDFDPTPFIGYDENSECITTTSYCVLSDGGFEINYALDGGLTCVFKSTDGGGFRCHD